MYDHFRVEESVGSSTGFRRSAEDHHGVYSDVEVTVRDAAGNIKSRSVQHNLRTNVGADFWHTQLFSLAPGGAGANYIAMTTDATAAAAADTVLATEETTNGLQRAQAGLSHAGSATSTILSKTFTYTGGVSKVIAKVGLFNAAAVGTMVLETLLSSTATVNTNGDQITISWTVNF